MDSIGEVGGLSRHSHQLQIADALPRRHLELMAITSR